MYSELSIRLFSSHICIDNVSGHSLTLFYIIVWCICKWICHQKVAGLIVVVAEIVSLVKSFSISPVTNVNFP